MIHIKCKKCGWRLPFSSKTNKDTVKNRGDADIVCPNCGQVLVKKGGKWKVYRWKAFTSRLILILVKIIKPKRWFYK